MSGKLKSDICVIGGGPAGATIACRLARLGYSVVVLEKQRFPRPHIGESLTPAIVPLFEVLGIRETMERQDFLRPESTLLHWPPFHGFKSFGSGLGFQVDRGRFDAVLLQAAEDVGAQTMQGARITGVQRIGDGHWNLGISWQARQFELNCRFLVDASGRRGLFGGHKRRYGRPTLALWAYWKTNGNWKPQTRVEAGKEEWFWGAPLPDGTFNATVFVDSERISPGLREFGTIENLYRKFLQRSKLLADCLRGTRTGPATACDATCYYDEQPATCDSIRVGEASFSIDPLSSQGVQAAIGSSLNASAVIHTILQQPHSRAIAEQFYRERQQETVAFHRSAAGYLYAEVTKEFGTPFWQSRGVPQSDEGEVLSTNHGYLPEKARLRLSPETQISPVPCLDDCFIILRPGVTHPALARPCVFLDHIAIAPLLTCFCIHPFRDEIFNAWSRELSPDRATRILNWLWEKHLITQAL